MRGLALGLLIVAPCFGKPRPHVAAKPKVTKDAPAAAATSSAEAAPSEPSTPAADETQVKAAGTKEAGKEGKSKVLSVEESTKDKGVKTYNFSAVEVEGRLKSPQIVYFLRRVRAEFEAGDLGHRSFMPELSDTRRSASLR
ncbi:MAG TPA: hypothetical protein VMI54_13050 [Polyangiaceae bacterium]|nr:hypothetical protein [Polyangiaceae bacterium]